MYNEVDTGRDFDNQNLEGNLVKEGDVIGDNGEGFQPEPQQMTGNDLPRKNYDDNSLHMDEYIEKIHQNPQFMEKEQKFSQQIEQFIRTKTGKSISDFSGYIFLANKILLATTLIEFLFQRFNIITLFLNVVILLIEAEIFTHKHIYKWLLVLLGSLLLDALVLLDIAPVSISLFILIIFLYNRLETCT